jgi:flagellar basal-body rod modification protein FlgD
MASMLTNYLMPATLNALIPSASSTGSGTASAKANAASSSGSSTSSTSSASSLGTTFLSLLAQELQNQDPTSPVDPTQMVGQMISLNQLEQLIGINQTLTAASGTTTTQSHVANGTTANTQLASRTGSTTNTLSPSAAGAATSQLPFDPNTMLPLGFANSGAAAASINSYLNPVTMGTSGTTSNASGGK